MDSHHAPSAPAGPIAIVGAGRVGTALAAALRDAGSEVLGPFGRGYDGADHPPRTVLLCVPDREIAAAAAALRRRDGMLVGHCSGAMTLAALGGHEAFGLHPLMTIPRAGAQFSGATAAIAGSTDRAVTTAEGLARLLGMVTVRVADADRVAYHASAAIASNQLLTVLELAERLAATAGLQRAHLAPIVRATVDNWLATGASTALTGPVVRGDERTISGHRDVVGARRPADVTLYDALLAATRRLAAVVPTGKSAPDGDTDHSRKPEDTGTGQAGRYRSRGDA